MEQERSRRRIHFVYIDITDHRQRKSVQYCRVTNFSHYIGLIITNVYIYVTVHALKVSKVNKSCTDAYLWILTSRVDILKAKKTLRKYGKNL